MTKFPQAPTLRPVTNDKWIVAEDFLCAFKGTIVTIKSGLTTDGASIPRIAWRIIGHPFSMPLLPCALIHDGLYMSELLSRKECDWLFLELMKRAGINWVKRNIVWSAVRAGGGLVWGRHTIDSVLKARKYCTCTQARKMVK